ncbi:heavy metal-binding domain-containing protein [Streptomyces sp. 5.8]|uniref:heavy metal-binding domain-containing protein n=1 Tax=Streptomyces sp. 5.8 TaxID=3406571 RepID=UPI003BB79BB1
MRRLAQLRPGEKGSLFTSDLSVNEFLLVREAGFRPLGLVLGSSVYHVGMQVGRWTKNQELTKLSQALYDARELAMSRMRAEASALDAEGIVAVQLKQHSHSWGSHTTEFFAIGTAVRPLRADHVIDRPTMVLGLDD